jgi:NADH-quinone oxidoreductase subunit H
MTRTAPPLAPEWSPVQLIEQLGVPPFYAEYVVWPAIQLALVFAVILTVVAYLVYMERKVSALMQARLGPMRVGPVGLLQPLADGIKLLSKEDFVPDSADRFVFLVAPVIGVATALGVLALVPFGGGWGTVADVNIGLLFILSVTSVGVFGIVLAGWASNSKYALLGAIRSSAQLISYEVAIGLALIGPLLFARSLSMTAIVEAQRDAGIWFVLFQPIAFSIYFVAALAETNRAPFDLPESESELVAGFHVEYSGFRWALFFMAEYTNIIVATAIATTLFLGGWWFPGLEWLVAAIAGEATTTIAYSVVFMVVSLAAFSTKVFLLIYAIMWVRWTLPRYRYDQLMDLGWKWLIPASLGNIVVTAALFVVGMRPDQGGLLGFVERLPDGSLGYGLGGVGRLYFIAGSLVTVGIVWFALATINRHTSDFNLHAQRQLQIQRRADRLAEAEKGA